MRQPLKLHLLHPIPLTFTHSLLAVCINISQPVCVWLCLSQRIPSLVCFRILNELDFIFFVLEPFLLGVHFDASSSSLSVSEQTSNSDELTLILSKQPASLFYVRFSLVHPLLCHTTMFTMLHVQFVENDDCYECWLLFSIKMGLFIHVFSFLHTQLILLENNNLFTMSDNCEGYA